ncbi:MAG: hypothetical protein AAFV88_23865 [Planctomycetota bacterium]
MPISDGKIIAEPKKAPGPVIDTEASWELGEVLAVASLGADSNRTEVAKVDQRV